MSQKSLKHKIKEMETAQRQQAQASILAPEQKVSFDEWWILLQKRMPLRPHMKEIIWADFGARGLKKEELAAKYDEGLKLFGL